MLGVSVGAIAQPAAGSQKPLSQNRPGQQLQPSVSGSHCWPLLMQHRPSGSWHVQRESGQLPQLPPQLSSPHLRSPELQCGVHATHLPDWHFMPCAHAGQVIGLPHESMYGPQASLGHGCGTHLPGSPQTFGVPAPPHVSGFVQVSPQWVVPPQVSGTSPHAPEPSSSQRSGMHGQSCSVAWP